MIGRQALQTPFAQKIGPRVANMSDRQPGIGDGGNDQRRGHAKTIGPHADHLLDAGMGIKAGL
jgi:hypothetical protein